MCSLYLHKLEFAGMPHMLENTMFWSTADLHQLGMHMTSVEAFLCRDVERACEQLTSIRCNIQHLCTCSPERLEFTTVHRAHNTLLLVLHHLYRQPTCKTKKEVHPRLCHNLQQRFCTAHHSDRLPVRNSRNTQNAQISKCNFYLYQLGPTLALAI